MNKAIALIPARAGSVRVPDKNIRFLGDKLLKIFCKENITIKDKVSEHNKKKVLKRDI